MPADTADDDLVRQLRADRRLREQAEDARTLGVALGPADQDAPGLAQAAGDLGLLADLPHLDVEHRQGVLDERDVQVLLRAEVEVDRADRQLRRASDQLDRRACVAALREHRASRLLDAAATRLPLLRFAFLSVRHGRRCSDYDAIGQAVFW